MVKDIIKKLKNLLLNLPETPKVYPEIFNDPVALKCGWNSLRNGSANFNTHRLIKSPENDLLYQSTLPFKLFGIFFAIIGLILITLYFNFNDRHWIMLVIGSVFIIAGVIIVGQSIFPIGFDSIRKIYYRGWKQKHYKRTTDNIPGVPFRQIRAIQLLIKIGKVSSSSENYHGDTYFYAYELNLILQDAGRKYVMSYIDKKQVLSDAKEISDLTGAPVWNTINIPD